MPAPPLKISWTTTTTSNATTTTTTIITTTTATITAKLPPPIPTLSPLPPPSPRPPYFTLTNVLFDHLLSALNIFHSTFFSRITIFLGNMHTPSTLSFTFLSCTLQFSPLRAGHRYANHVLLRATQTP